MASPTTTSHPVPARSRADTRARRTPRAPRTPRIAGLDIARGLAVLGMFTAHFWHSPAQFDWGTPASWIDLVNGRSSILFAVCAGVSFSLMTRDRGPEGPSLAARRLRMLLRAVTLFAIGSALVGLGTEIEVILPTYAVLFIATLPLVAARSRTIAGIAIGSLLIGPVLVTLGAPLTPDLAEDSLGGILFHAYPAVAWWSVFLVGVLVGRLDLRSTRVTTALAGVGVLATAAGYGIGTLVAGPTSGSRDIDLGALPTTEDGAPDPSALPPGLAIEGSPTSGSGSAPASGSAFDPSFDWGRLTTVIPHSGSSFELLGAIGVALLVIGVCSTLPRFATTVLRPIGAIGAMALTLYVAHIVAYRVLMVPGLSPAGFRDGGPAPLDGAVPLLVLIAASLVVATVWTACFRTGPVERMVRWASGRLSSAV